MHIKKNNTLSAVLQTEEKVQKIRQAILEQATNHHLGLFTGLSGITLLHSLDRKEGVDIVEYLDELFTQAETPKSIMTFCSGLSGMGWMVELLSKHIDVIDDTNLILDDLDVAVIDWMKSEMQKSNYDFMHGAIGGGLYLLKRIEKNVSETLIVEVEALTRALIAEAKSTHSGDLYWIQKAGTVGTKEDRINFGLSHGFPSILVFFCKVYKAGILRNELQPVISKVVQYLLNNVLDPIHTGNYFPTFLFPNDSEKNIYASRLAWCYGDISVCLALWHANEIIRSGVLEQFIIKVLKQASKKRGTFENKIRDAGVCHGSAGLGYIFYKFHQRYAINDFYETSQYWFQKTHEFDIHPNGPAGYLAYTPLAETNYAVEYGLLEGIAGIYCCIETVNGNMSSDWDEMFLIS